MIGDNLGPAQIAALVVLAQRGLEQLHSNRNTRRLLQKGAREAGGDFLPVVIVSHLAWIASIFLLIPRDAVVLWPVLVAFLLLQLARYWIIATLGRFWTHGVLTLDGSPAVTTGPYRFLRHPNYVVNVLETLLLPAAFGAVALGFVMAAICAAVMRYKAGLEDLALAGRRSADQSSRMAK
jgi:methyltransferase